MKLKPSIMVIKALKIIGIASLFGQSLFAQLIPLQARLCVQNAGFQSAKSRYVEYASVSTPFAKPTVSDDSGFVRLTLVGLEAGSIIALSIDHPELEVVNKRDVEQVVLGRRLPLIVSMAPKGQLAMAQAEFYKISKNALFGRYETIIADLKGSALQREATIKNLQAQYHQELENRFKAEELTRTKVEEMEAQLEGLALELATVNLDMESDHYRQAFEEFRKGNLQEVIRILDDSTMDYSLSIKLGLLDQLKSDSLGNQVAIENLQYELNQTTHALSLRAKAQKLLLLFSEAAATQEKAISILKVLQLPNGSPNVTSAYQELGRMYRQQGLTEKAISANQTAIEHAQSGIRPDSVQLIECFEEVSLTLRQDGQVKDALEWQTRALDFAKRILPTNSARLGFILQNSAECHRLNKSFDLAMDLQYSAIATLQNVPGLPSSILGSAFRSLARIFSDQGDHVRANQSIERAIKLEQASEVPNQRLLAHDFEQSARWKRQANDLPGAIKSAKEALKIAEQIEAGDHLDKAKLLIDIAELHDEAGDADLAMEFSKRGNAMYDSTHANEDALRARFLSVQSKTELSVGKPQAALRSIEQALNIQLQDTNPNQIEIAASYRQLAEINIKVKNFDAALSAKGKAIDLMEKSGSISTVDLAEQYSHLALCHVRKGNTAEAIMAHRRSIELLETPERIYRPDEDGDFLYFKNLGMVLMGLSPKDAEAFALERIKGRAE